MIYKNLRFRFNKQMYWDL